MTDRRQDRNEAAMAKERDQSDAYVTLDQVMEVIEDSWRRFEGCQHPEDVYDPNCVCAR